MHKLLNNNNLQQKSVFECRGGPLLRLETKFTFSKQTFSIYSDLGYPSFTQKHSFNINTLFKATYTFSFHLTSDYKPLMWYFCSFSLLLLNYCNGNLREKFIF